MLSTETGVLSIESILQSLKTASKFRTIKAILFVVNKLYNYKPLLHHIHAQNREIERKVIIELSSKLSYASFKSNEIIKRIGEDDSQFYIVIKGTIAELSLKYHKYFLTDEEYIIHLLKLKQINETELLSECIRLNKSIFPIKENIVTWLFKQNEAITEEYITKAKKSIEEIENANKGQDVNYYINITNNFSLKNNNSNESKTHYHIILPSYYYERTLTEGDYIGTLTLNARYKQFSTFVAMKDCDVGVLKKSQVDYPHVFNLLENIIKEDLGHILNGYFIFNHLSETYAVKQLSPLFSYKLINKGEILYKQNSYCEGIYLIKTGDFIVTTNKKYEDLNSLIVNLRHSLDFYENYPTDLKNNILEDFSNDNNNQFNPLLFSNNSSIQRNVVKEIKIALINKRQVIGLSEYYDKNNILQFHVECISKSGEVYFLPKESFFSIISKDSTIKFNACRLTEKNAKDFIEVIRAFKKQYISNLTFNMKTSKRGYNYALYHHDNAELMQSTSSLMNRSISNKTIKLTSNTTISFHSTPLLIGKTSHSQNKIISDCQKIKQPNQIFNKTLTKQMSTRQKTSKPTVFPTLFGEMKKNKSQKDKLFFQKLNQAN